MIFKSTYQRLKQSAKERKMHPFKLVVRWFFIHNLLPIIAGIMPHYIATRIHKLRGTKIGKDVHIARSTIIDESFPELITIEDGVRISHQCIVVAHTSGPIKLKKLGILPLTVKPVKICKYAYIGAKSAILPGVTVGEGAVVAAGSVVTKDVQSYSLVAGVPAVVKKKYNVLEKDNNQ